ncbi:MAG: site-specific DNA-methyltransferase [Treponemataceae bacterium]|nr:MAG: site-specific DNA-methyltransferase [Treponemataceae bacterium]
MKTAVTHNARIDTGGEITIWLNGMKNKLFYGDNLTIMRKMGAESVGLIYLDPPFNSNRSYNLLYKNTTGLPIPEQIEAFCDTWELDYEKSELARDIPNIMREYGIRNDAVQFWHYLALTLKESNPRLLAYLVYMTVRLIEMHRLLKPSGSIYLHCDPAASHYLKIVMDNIFGKDNFRNEIVWCYKSRPQAKKYFGRKHDIILFYSKTENYYFDWQSAARPLSEAAIKKYRLTDDAGRKYRLEGRGITGSPIKSAKDVDPKWEETNPELVVRDYLDEKIGVAQEDWWEINIINQSSKERLGYPTQKPLALLERIVKASSKEGDVVFDPFCGCGTTIEAAIKNHRQWLGCDIAIHSIKLIADTRIKKYGLSENAEYEIEGIPQSAEQARYLFEQDPFQFQYWAVEKTGGFCSNRKTADRGIDGRIYFEAGGELRSMVLSVKGGNIKPADVRDLRGVLEREGDTELAGFICLNEPTKAMREEADAAGFYEYKGVKYPRVQILTVRDIFDGRKWDCPSVVKTVRKDKGELYLAI